MKKKGTKQNIEDATILAEKIKLLWAFLADLIPYKKKLREVAKKATERSSMALSMAPILGAFGQDYEEVYLQKEIERKRAWALLNLIEVLDKTEKDMKKFKEEQVVKRKNLTKIRKLLGT